MITRITDGSARETNMLPYFLSIYEEKGIENEHPENT